MHITFSTKNRYPFIDEQIEPELYPFLGGICKELECNPIQAGGYRDHVHILCLLSRKITQMYLLEEVKRKSSKWIKTKGEEYSNFYWQRGYGIFSVNPADIDVVARYIRNQKEHHANKTFKEEFRNYLKKYHVDYDERYVWD